MRPLTRTLTSCGVALTMAAATTAAIATGAAASPSASPYCEPWRGIVLLNWEPQHIWDKNTSFKDGPGGTIVGSVTEASTLSGTFGAKGETTIGAIFAKVKVEVSGSVTKSRTITKGHSYSHLVSPGKYGHMRYGSWGWNVSWAERRAYSNCAEETLAQGVAKIPKGRRVAVLGDEGLRVPHVRP